MPYVFRHGYARITTREFPHSEIPGSKVGQHLPEAYRSRPRPSSALGAKASTVCSYSLDRKEHVLMSLWSFQGARGLEKAHLQRTPLSPATAGTPISQNSTAYWQPAITEVNDVLRRRRGRHSSRRAVTSDGPLHGRQRGPRTINKHSAYPGKPGLPRKEVIQPQLPLRLPCYDFTPIIDPTFDGCLPCGLAHRLRVLPTFVV